MSLYSRLIAFTVSISVAFGLAVAQSPVKYPALPGEAKVLLSTGDLLVTGGINNGATSNQAYIHHLDGTTTPVPSGMNQPRTGHSLTVLPNGQVLVFGGVQSGGTYARLMEIFDPVALTFIPYSGQSLMPRSGHTATLLSNGVVVVIGGTTEGGSFARDIEYWDYRNGVIRSQDVGLYYPRQGHSAQLMSNGAVLIEGGIGAQGAQIFQAEVFSREPDAFQLLNAGTEPPVDDSSDYLSWSEPMEGNAVFPIAESLKFRFSRKIVPGSFSAQSVSVQAVGGAALAGTIAVAESGRLAFFVPSTPLTPNTDYVISINGLVDLAGNSYPSITIAFHAAGGGDNDGPDDQWIPSENAYRGNWNSGTGGSPLQQLPALQAPSGVTAVAGQALGISGRPLARVTLSIGSISTKTDETGRFILKNVPVGHDVLVIDGSTANRPRASYGFFEVGVTVKSGLTNVLNYTIWMTQLDTVHAVTIPSPTTANDTVITSPLLPGLELHLPEHTEIIGRHGEKITQLTITPIPLDKPPFPLPTGVTVPIYFTIQPGGAEIRIPGSGASLKGAQLYYPNSYHKKEGTPYNFWNYDASSKGWYIYGNGEVNSTGSQIVPGPGVYVYELTGAMVGWEDFKNAIGFGPGGMFAGDPVDLASGQFAYQNTDLALSDVLPIALSRTYTTNDHITRPFGVGATDNYDIFMVGDTFPYTFQELIEANGTPIRFNRITPGTSFSDVIYASTSLSGPWYGATLWYNGGAETSTAFGAATWILKTRTGMLYNFPDSEFQDDQLNQALIGIQDPHGNKISLTRDGSARLTKISSPSGKTISLSYDASSRIVSAEDNTGNTVSYTYDSAGHVATATDVVGGVTTFTYDTNDNMTSITDARGIQYLANQYDSYGRVTQQTQADGGTYLFSWTPSSSSSQQWVTSGLPVDRNNASDYEGYTGLISSVTVTNPRGYIRTVSFDYLGRPVSDSRAVGQPEAQTTTYQYFADNLVSTVTDPLSRVTSFGYDANSNLTSLTKLYGTAGAVTSSATYDSVYNQMVSTTDPLGNLTSLALDSFGNVANITDAIGNSISFSYDSLGRLTQITDPTSNSTKFGYSGSDLTRVIDSLGNTTRKIYDDHGNLLKQIDPLGNITSYTYTLSGLVLTSVDAYGNQKSFTYDANKNVTQITDFRGNSTTYTYDGMDRPVTVTNPLSQTNTVTYDLGGEAVAITDRKGLVTSRTFDGLGRLTGVGFNQQMIGGTPAYESTVSYQLDAGNRITQITDSAFGTITRTYNGLDSLLTETSPSGTMTYTYDAAQRRATAQASGGTQITYGYDTANHLLNITQGTSQVGFTYDTNERRSTVALPNGISLNYGYDNDSQITSLSYSLSGSPIGSVSYTYDKVGHRIGVSGSLAAISLPPAMSSATYDAANQLTNWGGVSATYDANGNMLTDVNGNSYTWNARNQLASLTGGVGMSFTYDTDGRRILASIGSQATSYLYDGENVSFESNGTSSLSVLSGGVDEYFQFLDGSGTASVPLSNGIGSVAALTNASGAIATSYQYDPFGVTSTTGAVSANTAQFTGRDLDPTGLYYYRSRYYNPAIGRFISQDPMGFGAGVNFYAYVQDNPVSFVDPLGLDKKFPQGSKPWWPPSWWPSFGNPSATPAAAPNPGIPAPNQSPDPSNQPPCGVPSGPDPNTGTYNPNSIPAIEAYYSSLGALSLPPPLGGWHGIPTGPAFPLILPTSWRDIFTVSSASTASNYPSGKTFYNADAGVGKALGQDLQRLIPPCPGN